MLLSENFYLTCLYFFRGKKVILIIFGNMSLNPKGRCIAYLLLPLITKKFVYVVGGGGIYNSLLLQL